MKTPSLSTPVTRWLENICFERFGLKIKLTAEVGQTRIYLVQGAASSILVTAIPSMYRGNQLAGHCLTWDPVAEGYIAALKGPIPAPGAVQVETPLIEEREDGYTIHYDILGITYWMLSRHEEIGRIDLDEHGRFPATSSHAFKHGYLERPVVDEWMYILGQVIQRTWPGITLRQHAFSQKVSHDVDRPSRYAFRSWPGVARAMVGDVLKRRDFKGALLAPWVHLRSKKALHPADSANTFDWIMDVSERHGLISAFYFICGRTDPEKDADYEPGHPAIRELMRRIHKRGHEIGLHPSYGTFQQPDTIAAEAGLLKRICAEEAIQQQAWGGRMHYLRWETPSTLYGWEQAGLTYDSTLSYADLPGFRCGTCFEYPAFDPVAGKQLNLRIRPLIAMECTVMAPCYLGLGASDSALAKFTQLKDACRAVGGTFTLLWHNSEFTTRRLRRLYQDVLAA